MNRLTAEEKAARQAEAERAAREKKVIQAQKAQAKAAELARQAEQLNKELAATAIAVK